LTLEKVIFSSDQNGKLQILDIQKLKDIDIELRFHNDKLYKVYKSDWYLKQGVSVRDKYITFKQRGLNKVCPYNDNPYFVRLVARKLEDKSNPANVDKDW
jgi:hypothetical protein